MNNVLIVGAGPAGLVAAITLARAGIPALVVERRAGLSPFPRATAVSTRTMELIRSWGVEDEVRAGGIDVRHEGWVCSTLASPDGSAVSLGFPTAEQARAVSPTGPAIVPQDHLEPVLLAHLRRYRLTEVRFGVELVALDQDAEGVTAVLRAAGSATETVVRCSYVIGADGAHSAARSLVGIGMRGPGQLGEFLSVLFRAPLDRVVGERRYGIYMLRRQDRTEVLLPAGDGDRWLYSRQWFPDTESRADYTRDRLVELIRAGAGVADLPVRVLRVGSFSFAAQVADRYRDGRVFLAGDAAHRITPRGGTGMNTAIHDAYHLGWKLGWVLRGWAPLDLLDSYEEERRPVGIRNTMNSAGTEANGEDAFANDLGGRIPHVWQWRNGHRRSTLDLLGPGLTLLTGPHGSAWHRTATHLGGAVPVEVHGVDNAAAGALGIGSEGAVLVRPDGQAVDRWLSMPAAPALVGRSAGAHATASR
jgi:putative polyketide hydroxylase